MHEELSYEFECPICGLQSEYSADEYDPESNVVMCGMCETNWVVEVDYPGWLVAVEEIK